MPLLAFDGSAELESGICRHVRKAPKDTSLCQTGIRPVSSSFSSVSLLDCLEGAVLDRISLSSGCLLQSRLIDSHVSNTFNILPLLSSDHPLSCRVSTKVTVVSPEIASASLHVALPWYTHVYTFPFLALYPLLYYAYYHKYDEWIKSEEWTFLACVALGAGHALSFLVTKWSAGARALITTRKVRRSPGFY